jgi:hypothetical protein
MNKLLFTRIPLLSLSPSALGQTEYTVRGTLIETRYRPPEMPVTMPAVTNRFELFARGKQWRINLYTPGPTNLSRLVASVGSPNGTDILDERVTGPASLVQIATQPYPDNPAASCLWFMYLSSTYLAGMKDGKLPPIYRSTGGMIIGGRGPIEPPGQTAVVEFSDRLPKLPRYAAFINDAMRYTNALYEAEDYQRVGKVNLPRQVKFSEIQPLRSAPITMSPGAMRGPPSTTPTVMHSFEVTVDQILDRCPAQFVAIDLPQRFTCFDRRVLNSTNGAPIRYSDSDFTKLPTVGILERFRAGFRPPPPKSPSWPRPVMITLVLSGPVALAFAWLRQRRKPAAAPWR